MTVRLADIIVPDIWDPYISEMSTYKNQFIRSGIIQSVPNLQGVKEGGHFVNVPFWVANLDGDLEVMTDTTSFTPGKLTADSQVGVVLHRGRAWASRDLAALAAGSDPMAAIGERVSEYIANQQQKELLKILEGAFGGLASNTGAALETLSYIPGGTATLTAGTIAKMRSLLGDHGDKLSAIAIHSAVYYDLQERKLVDFVATGDALSVPASSFGGQSYQGAFGSPGSENVPFFCGLRLVVDDDVTNDGTNYAIYGFTNGAIGQAEQQGQRTETDRDILAKEDAMSIDMHWLYHPMGLSWTNQGITNPTRAQLATIGNWSKVYETKNIGVVRATVVSNF
jgi:hypothetical protein